MTSKYDEIMDRLKASDEENQAINGTVFAAPAVTAALTPVPDDDEE